MSLFSIELKGFNVPDPQKHRGAVLVFVGTDGCFDEATAAAKSLGYCVGPRDRNHPCAVAEAGTDVRKWSTLTTSETYQMAGTIGAQDWDTGPVVMRLDRVRNDSVWRHLVAIARAAEGAPTSKWQREIPRISQYEGDDVGVPVSEIGLPATSPAFLRRSEEAYYALGRGDAEPARRLLCDVLGRVA